MAEKFFSKISYLKIDVNNNEDWKNFSAQKYNNTRIFYLAISPALYQITTSKLKTHNCITDDSRIVVEKPIGSSLETAEVLFAAADDADADPRSNVEPSCWDFFFLPIVFVGAGGFRTRCTSSLPFANVLALLSSSSSSSVLNLP